LIGAVQGEEFAEHPRARSLPEPDWSLLQDTLLFKGVSSESVAAHLENCQQLQLDQGELLMCPERRNRYIYLIISGSLRVFLKDTTEVPLNTMGVGDCVGELCIIDSGYPTAYVVAAEPTLLMGIPHESLWGMVNASHGVARNLLYVLTRRVRNSTELIARHNQALREFERSSSLDALTDLYNRRWMEKMFAREVRRCERAAEPLALLVLDVDHFKRYNDLYGHLLGDEVLRQVADTLRAHMRANDMAARFGGDEIALLLPGMGLAEAVTVAQRLIAAAVEIELPAHSTGVPPPPTLSVGVADLNNGDTLKSLLSRADGALYEAKRKGRNRVVGRSGSSRQGHRS
jgi:diguanylate cyclase (GGDEF)-like protein